MGLLRRGATAVVITVFLSIIASHSFAQTVIFADTLGGAASNWSLNSNETIHGRATVIGGDNEWVINNSYTGGSGVPNTQAQPAGIQNNPNSNYMHIVNKNYAGAGISNANYYWQNPGNDIYFTKMNSSISTLGFIDVELSFWWLNLANSDTSGQVFYSTDGGTTWNRTANTYSGDSTWKQETIKIAAFNGQANLTFGFAFINPDTGKSPGFAIDDILITGKPSGAPTANFTSDSTTICKGSCVKFTDLSTGNPTDWHWDFGTGNAGDTSIAQNPTFCFNNLGSYSITLKVSNSAGVGAPMVKANYINVVDCSTPPVADFSMNGVITNNITICAGDSIIFADSSSGAVQSIYWAFTGAEDTTGQCRIVNDTIPVRKTIYPCPGNFGKDTTYEVSLSVSGPSGADNVRKFVTVQACVASVARIKGESQRKTCENDCITLEYDESVEDEFFISDKPSFKWYVWGISDSIWDSTIYCLNQPCGHPWRRDTSFTESSVTVCYPDSGTFQVALVTENIYGRDSIWYSDFVSVYGYPEVDALVDKPVINRGYSNELTTNNREVYNNRIVLNCRDLGEFEKFIQGDTSRCHNYYWSYKDSTGTNVYDNIDNYRSQTTQARPAETSWYYVIRENYNGCRTVDSVLVTVDSIYKVGIPDIFTPGRNGSRNSRWYVFGNRITKIEVKVFNRYGQIVYETLEVSDIVWESDIAPVGAGWDGTLRNEGNELDPGVYTYYIKLWHESSLPTEYKGNVTLMR